MAKIKVKIIYPLIQNAIRQLVIDNKNEWAEHDAIVDILLLNPKITDYISDTDNSDPLKKRVSNRVAWFSAHYTNPLFKKSMQEYISEFERKDEGKKKESEKWAYKLRKPIL